jgi:hypothetical protein
MMWVSRSTSTLWASARLAARVGGKMRRDLRKLRVRQPEVVQNHRRSFRKAENHNASFMPSVLWVRALRNINLNQLVLAVATNFVPIAIDDGKNIEFAAPAHSIFARGYEWAIESIVVNLIENAITERAWLRRSGK